MARGTFLTSDEVQDLIGYRQGAAQSRWLRERGYLCETGGDGREAIDAAMRGENE